MAKSTAAQKASSSAKRAGAALPNFVKPQLCKLVDTATSEPNWVHEPKLDGLPDRRAGEC